MRWYFKISFLLLLISQILLFGLALYHTDSEGVSWIFYHKEHWIWVLIIVVIAFIVFIIGVFFDVIADLQKEEWT
jgi:hypothetical protein